MTKQQENKAFVKMLKEFPKAFGRVSFRERLMLRTAFTYVIEEVIGDVKANYELSIEGRDVRIIELERENACLKARYDRIDIIGYDALKNLTNAKDIIRALLFHLTDDTFYVTYETKGQSVERARQFLRGKGVKESGLQKENEQLKEQIEKMKFWHDREEMVVIRDLLTEYMNGLGDDEYFDVAIFNVRNRLNGELKNE